MVWIKVFLGKIRKEENMVKKLIGFAMLASVSIWYTSLLVLGIVQNYRTSLAAVISCVIIIGLFESFNDSLKTGDSNE